MTTPAATYHGLGFGSHVLYGLCVHGGRETTDQIGAVGYPWAERLVELGLAVRTEDGYEATEAGWEVFYAGAEWSRTYYAPGVVQGKPVAP